MEAIENTARNNQTSTSTRAFIPADIGRDFNADYLDETICRDWILAAIHGRGMQRCPKCHEPMTGISSQRFWEGKRICCRACGKYFTALTGTFLSGCHLTFSGVILFAVFLYYRIPVREIARVLRISLETVRLWEIKFQALERVKGMEIANA